MKLDAIGFVSADLEKTFKFYSNLNVKFEQFEKSEHYEVKLDSGLRIMVDSLKLMKSIHDNYTYSKNSKISLCFKLDSCDEIDIICNRLSDAGTLVKAPWDAFWGQRYAIVADPDGNHIELFADL